MCFIGYPWKKIQHLFSEHATDFGFHTNWSKEQGARFAEALMEHKGRAEVIAGTYRGAHKGAHYIEASTRLWQFVGEDGNVIAAMKLGERQLQDLRTLGHVW